MMPMDPKKLINRFSRKCSQSAVFSHLHKIHFADIWLVSAYTVTYTFPFLLQTLVPSLNTAKYAGLARVIYNTMKKILESEQ